MIILSSQITELDDEDMGNSILSILPLQKLIVTFDGVYMFYYGNFFNYSRELNCCNETKPFPTKCHAESIYIYIK